jgi:DNA-binding NarL/FixJ family response regulator
MRFLMPSAISVLLVDDHALVRKGLRRLLEDDPDISVVGEASNGLEAVRLAGQLAPQVVVMDLAMPVMDGMEATREILKLAPATAVLVLSMSSEDGCVRKAFAAGARGYLVKDASSLNLSGAIREVAAGRCAPEGAER